MPTKLGSYVLNTVVEGDALHLVDGLPDASIDVVVTSPPYWGQRTSLGTGIEADPREYLATVSQVFSRLLPKLKHHGILWLNLGDAYNTPINWRSDDHRYSTLGNHKTGLPVTNSAYTKPRGRRRAFIDREVPWLTYGNLLGLPYRLLISLCDSGYLFRGEVIWRKLNPMPEGRARRPHRHHEAIYLLAKNERHSFRIKPPVASVWEFATERIGGPAHYSRFPIELPRQCIQSYGRLGHDVIVFDPFSGSGTTGLAALDLGCSYLGFEIDPEHTLASNERLVGVTRRMDL